ncbi:hypothetical protein H10PHJ05_38 [Aeromonas phage HJ05]|nr:hypothetical protein H10PHJ05_38 [Aeromonas phage HJ05]
MQVELRVDNLLEFELLLARASRGIERGLVPLVSNAARDLSSEIARTMKEDPKTGKKYLFRGRLHIASAAGESPAVRSGELLRSITTTTLARQGVFKAVGSPKIYARYLEKGTDRMSPRPAFEPSLAKVKTPFMQEVISLVKSGVYR